MFSSSKTCNKLFDFSAIDPTIVFTTVDKRFRIKKKENDVLLVRRVKDRLPYSLLHYP